MNKVQIRQELLTAFSAMVARIVANTGMKESDVVTLLGTYFATDAEAIDANVTSKFVSPKAAGLMAQKVLADWIDTAPDALDQLEEIANALNNDPDAFNTLKDATDGLRADITKYGLLGQILLSSTEGQNLVSTNWLSYESMANGVYMLWGDGSAIGNSAALELDSAKSTEYRVTIRPYAESPAVGEENRKVIRWEARQGDKVVFREVDSLVTPGSQSDWAQISGAGGSGGGSLTITDFTSWSGASLGELQAKEAGLLAGYATGTTALTWIGYAALADGQDLTNTSVAIQGIVIDDPQNPGDKIITLVADGPAGSVTAVITTVVGAAPAITHAATVNYVDQTATELGYLLALVPTLLGYKAGEVVSTLDGSSVLLDQGDLNDGANIVMTMAADGSFTVRDALNAGGEMAYWMPYGNDFTSTDYEIKGSVVATGGADATTGLSAVAFGAIADVTFGITPTTPGDACTLDITVEIHHVPTDTTTAVTFTIGIAA